MYYLSRYNTTQDQGDGQLGYLYLDYPTQQGPCVAVVGGVEELNKFFDHLVTDQFGEPRTSTDPTIHQGICELQQALYNNVHIQTLPHTVDVVYYWLPTVLDTEA